MPDAATVAQLEDLANAAGLAHHVAVLPDGHRKSRNLSPTGTVVAAKNRIVPRAVDTGINCGMRMVRSDIDVRDLTAPVLDAIFDELRRTIPVLEHEQDALSEEEIADIFVQGGQWSQKRFGLSDEELNCIENRATMPADSEEGIKYARVVSAASNFGFANRIALTEKLRTAMRQALHDESLQMPLLYDCAHVSIKLEEWNGATGAQKLWVHRHGASNALPPSRFASHPVFSKTGQPVPIPGSMGHHSFIGVADEKAVETFCSVNHGAGRVLDKPEALARFTEQQVHSEMESKNIRLYRYGTDNIAEQAPSSFKDISQVIRAMTALALARLVVRVRPVAILKG